MSGEGQTCRTCGTVFRVVLTPPNKALTPKAWHLCAHCGELSRFDESGRLRAPTAPELQGMSTIARLNIAQLQDNIRHPVPNPRITSSMPKQARLRERPRPRARPKPPPWTAPWDN